MIEVIIGLISIAGLDDATWWLDRVERAHPDGDRELKAFIHGAWSELHLYHGASAEAIRHGRAGVDAVDGRPANKGLLPLIVTVVVRANLQAGDIDGARLALADADRHLSGNAVVDHVRHPGLHAFVAASDGDLARAVGGLVETATIDALGRA